MTPEQMEEAAQWVSREVWRADAARRGSLNGDELLHAVRMHLGAPGFFTGDPWSDAKATLAFAVLKGWLAVRVHNHGPGCRCPTEGYYDPGAVEP